jgi:hypothetical protein
MKRKDDDIAVHRDLPLRGILFTRPPRKNPSGDRNVPSRGKRRRPVLSGLWPVIAAPFKKAKSFLSEVFAGKQHIEAQAEETKAPVVSEPKQDDTILPPPQADNAESVQAGSSEGGANPFKEKRS